MHEQIVDVIYQPPFLHSRTFFKTLQCSTTFAGLSTSKSINFSYIQLHSPKEMITSGIRVQFCTLHEHFECEHMPLKNIPQNNGVHVF